MVGSRSDRSPASADQTLYAAAFTAAEVAAVRQRIQELSAEVGLGDRLTDWVAAVNELLTNAVRHGGGSGRVRLWHDGLLRCEVSDVGAGFPVEDYLGRSARPRLSATGGMGLWIVQQMSDAVTIDSGPAGTTARIGIDPRA